MNGSPTAAQKRFHQWCRDKGCILTIRSNPDLHHIKGSKMKLKGCVKPGEWYVIPIIYDWHNYYGKPNAIHRFKPGFEQFWQTTEKKLWIKLIKDYEEEHGKKPMSEHEYQIIVERA